MSGRIHTKRRARAARAALMLIAVGAMAACDNPVGEGSHVQPDAIEVRSNGSVLASAAGAAGATGSITLQVGQALPVTVHFLRQGQELTIPHGYWLRLRFQDGPVPGEPAPPAPITWEPGTQGGFTGTIRGVAPGSRPVIFDLVHGPVGSGHADFTAQVPVVVPAP